MMRQGMGVRALTLTSAMERGMCPLNEKENHSIIKLKKCDAYQYDTQLV